MRILGQYESASTPQEQNALLRREGIYSAYIPECRRERDGIEAGLLEIIADEQTAAIKAALSAGPAVMYADQFQLASGQVAH